MALSGSQTVFCELTAGPGHPEVAGACSTGQDARRYRSLHKFPHFGGASSGSPTSLFSTISGPRLTQPSENCANTSSMLYTATRTPPSAASTSPSPTAACPPTSPAKATSAAPSSMADLRSRVEQIELISECNE